MNIIFTKHAAQRHYERLRVSVKHNVLYDIKNYVKTDLRINHNKSDKYCDVYVYIGTKLRQHALLVNDKSDYFKQTDKRDYRVVITTLLFYDRQDNHYSNQIVRDAYARYKNNEK